MRGREPSAQGGPRRSKHHNPWGLDEAQALIEGVSRCGGGKWADIKKLGFPELEHRTNVVLKDKWRTLTRAPPRDMLDRVQELNMKFKK